MTELLHFIERAGVPALIALVVLLRIEKRLDALTKAVLQLPSRIQSCPYATRSEPQESTPTIEGE